MGQRLGEGPGHREFLQLGSVLELWLLFVLQLVLGPVWELVLELGLGLEPALGLAQELGLVGELGLGVAQWLY